MELQRAAGYELVGDWADAISAYQELLSSGLEGSERCEALIGLSRCLLQSGRAGQLDEASYCLEQANVLLGDVPDVVRGRARLQRGRLLDARGDLRSAMNDFQEARELLKAEPSDFFKAELVLAGAERRRGELNLALERLEDLDRDSVDASQLADYFDELGAVHLARGDVKAAIDTLAQALELDQSRPDDYLAGSSRLLLAEAYIRDGNFQAARPLIDRALQTYEGKHADTGRSEALALMGFFFEESESYQLAAQYYQAGLDLDRSGDDVVGLVRAHRALGRVYRKSGDQQRARELFGSARALLRGGDDVEAAALCTEEGLLALEGSEPDYAAAMRSFERALRIAEEDKDERAVAVAKRNVAKALRENNDLKGAVALLEEARVPLEERGDLRELNDLLDDLGQVLIEQGHWKEALVALSSSLELDHQLGASRNRSRTLLLMGRAHVEKGERERAREFFQQVLDLYQSAGATADRSEVLHELGWWNLDEGKLPEALRCFREGLAIDLKRDDRLGMIRANRGLAALFRRSGDYRRAREHIEDAEDQLRGIDDPPEKAQIQMERGRLALAEGSTREARDLFEAAQRVFASDRAQSVVQSAMCQRMLARVAMAEGDLSVALELLEQARTVFDEARDMPELDETYDDLGQVYLLLGNPVDAEQAIRRSLAVGREMGWERGKGRSYLLLGSAAVAVGEFSQAGRHFEEALDTFEAIGDDIGRADALEHLADWYASEGNAEGDLSRAIGMYKRARQHQLERHDLRGVGRTHRKLARTYRLERDYGRAADALEAADDNFRGVSDPREIAPLEFERGALAAARNDQPTAVSSFRRALSLFQELSLEDDVTRTYHGLISAYQAQGEFRQALECMHQIGLQQASMWDLLVGDLHPKVKARASASFTHQRYQDAISAAFVGMEAEVRERTAAIVPDLDPKAPFSAMLPKLVNGMPVQTFGDNAGREAFLNFATAAFTLFRNPSVHSAYAVDQTEAFAQLCLVHLLFGMLDTLPKQP